MNTSLQWCIQQFWREYRVFGYQKHFLVQAILFFLMLMVIFPLTMTCAPQLFKQIFPGVLWISLTLAVFLSTTQCYQPDLESGYIEQWLVLRQSLAIYVGIKVSIRLLQFFLSVLLVAPWVAFIYQLSYRECGVMLLSLWAGLPSLISMTSVVIAFGMFGSDKALVMNLVLLPLLIPVMILGGSVTTAVIQGDAWSGLCAYLAALSLFMVSILPIAAGYILRICVEEGL